MLHNRRHSTDFSYYQKGGGGGGQGKAILKSLWIINSQFKLKDKTLKFYIIISLQGLGNSKKILDCINLLASEFFFKF